MHLADTFIQSDLQCIQVILFFFLSVHGYILLTLLSCHKLNRFYIKLSLVNILEMFFLCSLRYCLKFCFSKGTAVKLIYAEHCICYLLICYFLSLKYTICSLYIY